MQQNRRLETGLSMLQEPKTLYSVSNYYVLI